MGWRADNALGGLESGGSGVGRLGGCQTIKPAYSLYPFDKRLILLYLYLG